MNTSGGPGGGDDGWTIIVPVKSLEHAKSRLGSSLSPQSRRTLVLAMAADVVLACLGTRGVSRVRVVSSDPDVADLAARLGAEFVVDPAPVADADPLNAALAVALDGVRGPAGVVTADLPELAPELLGHILDSAAQHAHSFVADHRGEGTTMVFWTDSTCRVTRFGPGSADRYRTEGNATSIPASGPAWDAASRDVDIPGDVSRLRGRRVGTATARALQGGSPPVSCRDRMGSATMVS